MTRSRKLLVLGLALAVLTFAAAALAAPLTHGGPRTTTAVGPGMMSGYSGAMMMGAGSGMMGPGSGMMGGYAPTSSQSSPGSLSDVRDWVERWLESRGFDGFRVGEVMAFTNNDYVLVEDANGKPAFELLTGPGQAWLMEEPVSMMWNTRYGMMRGWTSGSAGSGTMGPMMGGMMSGTWNDAGDWNGRCGGYGGYGGGQGSGTAVTAAEAISIAERYLAQAGSGEQAEQEAQTFPGYFTIDTVRNGTTVGMLSVSASTGAVWYHRWHGSFLGEREF